MVSNQKHVLLIALVLLFLPLFVSAQWIETTIVVGSNPRALVYNPINNKVYCANEYSNDVTVIDGATDAVIKTIAVGDGPRAFTWNYKQNLRSKFSEFKYLGDSG